MSSVISDMESRHERELHQSREQTGVLQNRLSQNGAADRSQVQQLNIRIVSQAAEIRSLQKQVKDLQSSEVSTETEYETILNDQPMSEKSRDRALNERHWKEACRPRVSSSMRRFTSLITRTRKAIVCENTQNRLNSNTIQSFTTSFRLRNSMRSLLKCLSSHRSLQEW